MSPTKSCAVRLKCAIITNNEITVTARRNMSPNKSHLANITITITITHEPSPSPPLLKPPPLTTSPHHLTITTITHKPSPSPAYASDDK
ncbi:hypothetical protein E2C01_069374 [Portunus trituberculatus]|uniref:Uncharacterized protein n=1 Tax=Portunus trituberculatus TaxID=210409 RepID=A0A5B7HPW6_PORTR|nr:hypothetical protein [Portunus trituberculatus]